MTAQILTLVVFAVLCLTAAWWTRPTGGRHRLPPLTRLAMRAEAWTLRVLPSSVTVQRLETTTPHSSPRGVTRREGVARSRPVAAAPADASSPLELVPVTPPEEGPAAEPRSGRRDPHTPDDPAGSGLGRGLKATFRATGGADTGAINRVTGRAP